MPFSDPVVALEYRKQYYIKNKELKKQQATEYYYLNHDKRKLQKKEWAIKNAEKLKKYRKAYSVEYKKRKVKEERARLILNLAVNNGTTMRPDLCSCCGKTGTMHGHHVDYDKPLDVVWLCHQCHFALHRKNITNNKENRNDN